MLAALYNNLIGNNTVSARYFFFHISGGRHIASIYAEVVAECAPVLFDPFFKMCFHWEAPNTFFNDARTDHKHQDIKKNSSSTTVFFLWNSLVYALDIPRTKQIHSFLYVGGWWTVFWSFFIVKRIVILFAVFSLHNKWSLPWQVLQQVKQAYNNSLRGIIAVTILSQNFYVKIEECASNSK